MTDAPCDRSGGDAEAKPPDLAAPPHTALPSTTPAACPRPAPHARPRLGARERSGAPSKTRVNTGRPGARLQEQLLLDFHTTAVPGSVAPPAFTAHIWFTPSSCDPVYNLALVRNMVNYHLTTYPSRLVVVRVAVRVFRVRVASVNVANAIVVRGSLRLGRAVLLPHSSFSEASAAALAVAGRGDDARPVASVITPAVAPPSSNGGADTVRTERLLQRAAPDNGASGLVAQSRAHSCAQRPGACPPDVSPCSEAATCRHPFGAHQLPPTKVATGVNAPHPPATPGSYLKALLTPAPPPKTLTRAPKPILSQTGCFRCLAPDHKVRDCRDPPRCRNCRGSGHRVRTCPMPVSRMLTPWPRHQPTVPVPASRASVHAVPFSPRSASPPPPPTPASIPTPPAYNPLNLVASSSAVAPDFELPKLPPPASTLASGTILPRAMRSPTRISPVVDVHVVDAKGKAPATSVRTFASRGSSPVRRSPPSPASPTPSRATPPAPAGHPDWPSSDSGEEETVESGASEFDDSEFDDADYWEGRTQSLAVWLPAGDATVNERLAFVDVQPAEVCANIANFLRAALAVVAPLTQVELLPSSRGAMLLRFAHAADREFVRGLSPINHEGVVLTLTRPEETCNRFFRVPEWLAYVAVLDFPPEHWFEDHVVRSFSGFGNVAEIAPVCLAGYDYSPLRVLVEVYSRLDIPSELYISAPGGLGSVARLMPIRVWPRQDQVGPDGNLLPFFGPPPPPPPQHNRGGPVVQGALQQAPAAAPDGPPAPRPGGGPPHAQMDLPHAALLFHIAAALASFNFANQGRPAASVDPPLLAGEVVPQISEVEADAEPPLPPTPPPSPVDDAPAAPGRGRPPRARAVAPAAPKRQSSRLAAKAAATFVPVADQAIQRKALINSLAPCSAALKNHVEKRGLLHRNKLPISVADLRKMVSAAGLGCAASNAVGVVSTMEE
ncbi:unnamed protein product [Urochloa humidicola]